MTDYSNLNCKHFEGIAMRHNPMYKTLSFAIELVLKFVANTGCVIYGGTAMDMALREAGSKLYDDEMRFADIDFYSPDNVNHAYDLVDLLRDNGFEEARCLFATHVTTMRVDVGNYNWIADISYVPETQFKCIKTLSTDGIKFVHPDFQRIDLHNPFSFPYMDAPREAIFHRWKKDMKRLNLINTFYPIKGPKTKDCGATRIDDVLENISGKLPITGMLAYEIIYNNYLKVADLHGFSAADVLVPLAKPVIVYVNKTANTDGYTVKYREFGTILPSWGKLASDGHEVIIGDTLISINSYRIGERSIRYTNIHYLLRMFLAIYFTDSHMFGQLENRKNWLGYYSSLYNMITQLSLTVFTDGFNDFDNPLYQSFLPCVNVYGYKNISLATRIGINRVMNAIGKGDRYNLPKSYKIGEARPGAYGYDCELYQLDGSEIIENNKETEVV